MSIIKYITAFAYSITYIKVSAQDTINEFKEFTKGNYYQYSSNGEGKSLGIKFTVKYPTTWKSTEGDRPHIPQKFMGKYESLIIYINKINDTVFSQETVNLIYTREGLQQLLGVDSFIKYDLNQQIDGIRAATAIFYAKTKRLDFEIFTKNLAYVMIYKNYIIKLHFILSTNPSNKFLVDQQYKTYEPLFRLMANSFVLISQWE